MLQLFKPFQRVKMYITQSDHLFVQSMQTNGIPGCIMTCPLKPNTEYTIYFSGITNTKIGLFIKYDSNPEFQIVQDYCFLRNKQYTFKNEKDTLAYIGFIFIDPPHLRKMFILMNFKITANLIVKSIDQNIQLQIIEEPEPSYLSKDNTCLKDNDLRDSSLKETSLKETNLTNTIPIENKKTKDTKILYVVSNPVIDNNVGYAIRTNYIASYIPSFMITLNPFLDKNKQFVSANNIVNKNNMQYIYYDIANIIEYIKREKITKIIVCSDGINFVSFYDGLKQTDIFDTITWFYEVRGLWYLSAEANYKYKKMYSLKKSYLDHLKMIEKDAFQKANVHIFITDEVAMYAKQQFNNKPSISIYNGVCLKTIEPLQKSLTPTIFTIGVFGSIVPYEGIHLLVKACIELYRTHKQIRLLIIGNNKMNIYLRHPCITYIPWVLASELQKYYSIINLYCIPRLNYNVCHLISPLKPFEPFYHKIPVLMSNCRCLISIAGNGSRCKLFERDNIHSLKQHIVSIMIYGYQPQLLENAYQFVYNDRNWENQCNRYIEFINMY